MPMSINAPDDRLNSSGAVFYILDPREGLKQQADQVIDQGEKDCRQHIAHLNLFFPEHVQAQGQDQKTART